MEQFKNKAIFIEDENMLNDLEIMLDCKILHFVSGDNSKTFNYLKYAWGKMVLIYKNSALKLERININQFKGLLGQ